MNQVLEIIKSRRSVRKYNPIAVSDEQLHLILESGLQAPSAHNDKGCHLTVVKNASILDQMNEETKKIARTCGDTLYEKWGHSEKFNIFYHAPTVIVLSGKDEAYNSYIDCAAAAENMLLSAESLNIGTCWIGVIELLFREQADEYRTVLDLPDNYTPLFAVTVGNQEGPKVGPPVIDKSLINYID